MGLRFVMLGSGAVRDNPNRGGPAQILQVGDRVRPDKQAQNASAQPAGQAATPGSSEAPLKW